MICCSEEKLEQKLELELELKLEQKLELTLEQKLELTLELEQKLELTLEQKLENMFGKLSYRFSAHISLLLYEIQYFLFYISYHDISHSNIV